MKQLKSYKSRMFEFRLNNDNLYDSYLITKGIYDNKVKKELVEKNQELEKAIESSWQLDINGRRLLAEAHGISKNEVTGSNYIGLIDNLPYHKQLPFKVEKIEIEKEIKILKGGEIKIEAKNDKGDKNDKNE